MLKLSRPHVRIPRYLIDPRTEEELAAEEARIEAEGDNGTFIPDLTLKDANTLDQLYSKELTLDQLKELAEREDVVGQAAAEHVCKKSVTVIGLIRQNEPDSPPKTPREKVARETLKKILPKLFADCGRKPQLVKGRHCWLNINLGSNQRRADKREIPEQVPLREIKTEAEPPVIRQRAREEEEKYWWRRKALWCRQCNCGTELGLGDSEDPNWVRTEDPMMSVSFRCLKCGDALKRDRNDPEYPAWHEAAAEIAATTACAAIYTVKDWMYSVPDTTRGKVAGVFFARSMPEFFALSDQRPSVSRQCKIPNPVYAARSERAFRDKTLSMGIRAEGATRLLLARWHAFEDKYQKAKVKVHCCAGQCLSWREMLVIVVYERGDPSEIFEQILWRGIEADHAPGETILKDYAALETIIERQRHGNCKARGGSLLATLRTYCRRDWLKTVAPNLQKNGSLQQRAAA